MRALVLRNKELTIKEIDRPKPGPGQVLARVLASGICGSDLHVARFMEEMIEASRRQGGRGLGAQLDPGRDLVMGHEYVAEIAELGPGVDNWSIGARVSSIPITAYNPDLPGAYSEYVLMNASLLLPVPQGLPNEVAAMTEPCAVGLHAARGGRVDAAEIVLIMGAGPIGLMTLLWLKKAGVANVIVSDPAPARRDLAATLGADHVIDPASGSVAEAVRNAAGSVPRVVFECVGVEGTLQQAIDTVAPGGRIVVAGVCLREDRILPLVAIDKQVNIQFVLAYTQAEFAEALEALGDGSVGAAPLVTRMISLDELPAAFAALADPDDCKVVVTFP
jgi:2-desacetyl-2-hydroxyethyl bacteriochlorophyllide A dehydrogenase